MTQSKVEQPSNAQPLTYEQELHAVLHAAASNTQDLLRYFETQAKQENGEAKKLTQKCIEWKRDDLRRIQVLIPQALERRDALHAPTPAPPHESLCMCGLCESRRNVAEASAPPPDEGAEINIYELHQKMTAHLFPAYSSTDERFLGLAIAGEVGELCNMLKKRWRDGKDLTEEIRDEIADIRVYLELLAKIFDIEGNKLDERVQSKLRQVVERRAALPSPPLSAGEGK